MTISKAVAEAVKDLAFQESHFVPVMFYPETWTHVTAPPRKWKRETFPPTPRKRIPKEPGVYIFVLMREIFGFPHGNAVFYIGKATSLYERIGAYLADVDRPLLQTKRPLAWRMLNQWDGHLLYFYTTTQDAKSAESLETELLEAFRPPFNKQFEATTSQFVRAFL